VSWLEVHAAENIGEATVGAQRITQLILADLENNSDRLKGSGYEALTTGIDLHPKGYANLAHLAEGATECGPGLACRC
jgi:hypothetical protein